MATVAGRKHWLLGKSSFLGADRTVAYGSGSILLLKNSHPSLLTRQRVENYMEHPPGRGNGQTPGALSLGQANATRIYCAFYIFYYTTPIFFAVIADSYLGQYPALLASVALYCLGCVVLTTTSTASSLDKGLGLPGLVLSMLLVGLGGGGFRAIIVAFIADQHTDKQSETVKLKTGEHVRTDYQLTLQYIYNLHYWCVSLSQDRRAFE